MKKHRIFMMGIFIVSVIIILSVVVAMELNDNSANMTKDRLDNPLNQSDTVLDHHKQDMVIKTKPESTIEIIPEIKTELNEKINAIDNEIKIENEINKEINMVFAGDFYISSYIEDNYNKYGLDAIIAKDLQHDFQVADIAMINQEFPFSERGEPAPDKQFTFRINPRYVDFFKEMGIDIVTLANNHVLDYGTDALLDTLSTLNEANINHVGAGEDINKAKEASLFNIGGKSVAILGASRVIPVYSWNATSSTPGLLTTYDPALLVEEIKLAKAVNDYVIVYVHWGIERNIKPELYQTNLAKAYIDAGADIVIGSHPHVLQGIEFYKNKPIIYSLGNFVFYNSIEQTMLLKIKISENDQMQIKLIPCYAENACTRRLEDEKSKERFYAYIEDLSFDVSIDSFGNVTNLDTKK